jgi:ATP sulfurylase
MSWDITCHDAMLRSVLQDDDIPGVVRYRTYEVLKEEVANPQLRWAYLPYSMHMAGPREAIQVPSRN